MSLPERRAFTHEVISGHVKAEDYAEYSERWYLCRAFGPSQPDEPVITPDELVEQHLREKPDRLRQWLETNATPEEVMKHANPQEWSDFMEARAAQQAQQTETTEERRQKNLDHLSRQRAEIAARRARKREEEAS